MRIKFYFSILVLFLLGLGGVLLYLAKGMKPLHLYIVEGIIAFILVFLFIFYRKIVKPMNIIGSGMELLREQDFSSRLSKVGQYEADRIVNVFNRMMEQLKNERLRLREQNHFLDLLIQASPMGVVITTLNGEISQLNPMGLKMMGVRLEEIMGKKKRSASSSRWLNEHFKDPFVQKAHKQKLRSRAYFKLDEIQQTDKLFKPGMTVVDLGAAPGGWSQYVVSQIGGKGRVIACDILDMNPIVGVDFLQGDFRDENVLNALLERVGEAKVDVVMSDMAPNFSGMPSVDIPRAMYLVELALDMCKQVLAKKGSFVVKVFQGEGFDEYLCEIRSLFSVVKVRKPEASRGRSREVYIVASGYKGE